MFTEQTLKTRLAYVVRVSARILLCIW